MREAMAELREALSQIDSAAIFLSFGSFCLRAEDNCITHLFFRKSYYKPHFPTMRSQIISSSFFSFPVRLLLIGTIRLGVFFFGFFGEASFFVF